MKEALMLREKYIRFWICFMIGIPVIEVIFSKLILHTVVRYMQHSKRFSHALYNNNIQLFILFFCKLKLSESVHSFNAERKNNHDVILQKHWENRRLKLVYVISAQNLTWCVD